MHLREAEIGDLDFPLEAEPEDISRDHELIGARVQVTPYASEILIGFHGKMGTVTGVIRKRGQVAGLEVEIEGRKFYAPKKDWFIDQQYVEDVHLQSARAVDLKRALLRWEGGRDYYGSSWDGIELFHFYLAKRAERIAIEAAGWYRYPSSLREDQDGKDWRLVIPDGPLQHVAVNCHSLLHDGVWTLATTLYSTRQIDRGRLRFVGDTDFWRRVILWTLGVAEALQTSGYDYSLVLKALRQRLVGNQELMRRVAVHTPSVEAAAGALLGRPVVLPPVSAGFSRIRLAATSVGRLEPPTDEAAYAILSVRPTVARDSAYLDTVVRHELAHLALLGTTDDIRPHGELFQALGKALGIPAKYRD